MSTRDRFGLPGPSDIEYWHVIREWANELESDGCSFTPFDLRLDTCLEHDTHWRSGHTLFGEPISKWEANQAMREAIQQRSRFGTYSPLAAIRFIGVSIGAFFKRGQ